MKIGIDLGGTNMRIGVVDKSSIIKKEIIPCPSSEPAEKVTDSLCNLIERNMSPDIDGIGIGVPTLVDSVRGIVYNATNIPSWREVHLKEILTRRFGIVIGGKLFSGRNTGAAEIGELPFREHNFEYYCSSIFFEREYGISGKNAAVAAREGNSEALAIWKTFGTNVGSLMKAVMFAYDPEIIVIGGGLSSAFDIYKDALSEELSTFPYPESLRNIRIEPARLADVAILGASALV